MIKKFIYLSIILAFVFQSCIKQEECSKNNITFGNNVSIIDGNILSIELLNYTYKGKALFSYKLPTLSPFTVFEESNYLMTDDSVVYKVEIFKSCENEYQNGSYVIFNQFDTSINLKNSSICNIAIVPLLKFNQSINDTFKLQNENYWVILEDKNYDTTVKDTLYRFAIRHFSEYEIMLVASKKNGITGLAKRYYSKDLNKYFISETLGHIFPKDSLPSKYQKDKSQSFTTYSTPSVNLDLIKEFEKCSFSNK